MRRLLAVAIVAFAFGTLASACHNKNEAKNPSGATADAGPAEPEHHYPRE